MMRYFYSQLLEKQELYSLGSGSLLNHSKPHDPYSIQVESTPNFQLTKVFDGPILSMAAGNNRSVVITENGRVLHWECDSPKPKPLSLTEGMKVDQIALSATHIAAVTGKYW